MFPEYFLEETFINHILVKMTKGGSKLDLITQFVEIQSQLNTHVINKKVNKAKNDYQKLLILYNKINSSEIDTIHKSIAHDQLTKAYEDIMTTHLGVKKEQVNSKINHKTLDYAIVGILALLIVGVLFLKPEFIGFAILGEPEFSELVDIAATQDGTYTIRLKGIPKSLKVSGFLEGNGNAKIYMINGIERILIAEISPQSTNPLIEAGISGTTFEGVCEESCEIKGLSRDITLYIEIKNARLFLSRITYKADVSANNPPIWIGGDNNFNVLAGKLTTFDLNNYFEDPDENELVYLATNSEDLNIIVINNLLVINPSRTVTGSREITLIASDLITTKKVPVIINII